MTTTIENLEINKIYKYQNLKFCVEIKKYNVDFMI
jgi:hypothetical protein